VTIFRQYKKYLFLLIFPAVCILFYNSAINIHSHKLDGDIITHAHPFTDNSKTSTPYQNHKHTSLELFFFDKIFFLFSTIIGTMFAVQIILNFKVKARIVLPEFSIQKVFTPLDNSRGPPTL
jgi:hypothetical protein